MKKSSTFRTVYPLWAVEFGGFLRYLLSFPFFQLNGFYRPPVYVPIHTMKPFVVVVPVPLNLQHLRRFA